MDLGVYRPNASLRLFNSFKLDKFGVWSKRQFSLANNSSYAYVDTMPSYINDVDIKMTFNVMFDEKCPYDVLYTS